MNLGCPPGMSIGVSILSRELREAGHHVKITHLSEVLGYPFDKDRIIDEVTLFDPHVFAISFGTNHFKQVKTLVRHLKHFFPDKKIICGGIHTTLSPDEVFSLDEIDIICIGEADRILAKFINLLESGDGYQKVNNFWIKDNGKFYKNPLGPLPDITNQTFLDFESINYSKITTVRRGFAEVMASRGCPHSCTYCQNNALIKLYQKSLKTSFLKLNYCRNRSVDNLIHEIRLFREAIGEKIKVIMFADDSFTKDREWLLEFSEQYPKEIGISFICCSNVNEIDEDVVTLLDNAGCNMVKFGIESGSEEIRGKILKKQFNNKMLFESVNKLKSHELNILSYIMIGIPTETEEDMQKTFQTIASLEFDVVHLLIFYPFPNTWLYDFCKRSDLIDEESEPSNFLYTSKLKLPSQMKLTIDKNRRIFPWLLNKYLYNDTYEKYQPLIEKVYKMSEDEWKNTKTNLWIYEISESLSDYFRKRKVLHYFNPFPDRPDTSFLYKDRVKKIINIDN